jgi:parallel beta-helix repeat protein
MSRLRVVQVVLVLVAIGSFAPPASAAAATPVSISCGLSPGLLISTSGKFRITDAVVDCASTTIVQITASNVSLDLGGRLLDAVDATCVRGIDAPAVNKVRVFNGAISDCNDGINFATATNSAISNMGVSSVENIGVLLGSRNSIKGSVIRNGGIDAVDDAIQGVDRVTVANNTVRNFTGDGIQVSTNSTVVGNAASEMDNDGLQSSSDGNTFKNNVASNNLDNGIELDGSNNVASGNQSHGNDDDGFNAGNDCLLTKNVVTGNGDDGIAANEGCRVIANEVKANENEGIEVVGDDAKVGNNTIAGNVGDGIIIIGKGAIVAGNRIRGNNRGIVVGDEAVLKSNKVTDNDASGIEIDAADNLVTNTKLTKNRSDGNLGDGILVVDPFDTGDVFKQNVTNGNGQQGIDTNAGPVGGALTNRAKGNVVPPQCDSNLCP